MGYLTHIALENWSLRGYDRGRLGLHTLAGVVWILVAWTQQGCRGRESSVASEAPPNARRESAPLGYAAARVCESDVSMSPQHAMRPE